MIYQRPYLLAVCIASLFVPYQFRTKANEMRLLVCSSFFFYYQKINQCFAFLFTGYQKKIECYVIDSKRRDIFFKRYGIDSKRRENFFERHEIDSKRKENILKCYENLKKRIRKQVSRIRNRLVRCRNIIYWLSFIISNFYNCMRVHSNRLYLFDRKKEKHANRITDKYLEKHSFRIIISKSWLNFKDRSPPINTYTDRIGLVKFG